jgi:hypothetical protein
MVPDPMECGGMETLLLYGELALTVPRGSGGFKSLAGSSAGSMDGVRAQRRARGMV